MPADCIFGCIAVLAAAQGQSSPPEPASADEIIVTGERVGRSLRETPSSVAVFTGTRIEKQTSADRIEQLLELVPNVQMGTGGQGPTIRGQDTTGPLQDLPAFVGGNRPRVTLQVDGRAATYNEFVFGIAPLWDVAQVEVFRSPQTTTQGANAIAGAIFVRTRDPDYRWDVKGRAIAGTYATRQGSAVVGGPVVEGQLAFRLAADLRHSRPSSELGHNAIGADPDHDDYGLLRFKLLAEPAAISGLRLVTSYVHSEAELPQFEGLRPPFRERRDLQATYGIFSTNVDSLTANLSLPLSPRLGLDATASAGDARVQRFAPAGLGQTLTHSRDRSLEALLDWRPGDVFRAHGGAHYMRTRYQQDIGLFAFKGIGSFDDVQRSLGLFGEVEARPSRRWSLIGGLRYQTDRQDRSGFRQIDGSALIDFSGHFTAWLPKASIAYKVTDQVSVGLMAQRAYNPGGATLNFETGAPELFGPETLWSYEAFLRSALAGGRLRITGNLFYNDFRNAQRAQNRTLTVAGAGTLFWAEIVNVPKAEAYGLEAALDWRATKRLEIRGALGLLETKIVDAGDVAASISGNSFQRSPKLTATASVNWRPVDAIALDATIRHHSRYYSDDLNSPVLRIAPGTLVNARISYTRGPLSLFGYARNVFDAFNLTYMMAPNRATAEDPRELGIGLEASF